MAFAKAAHLINKHTHTDTLTCKLTAASKAIEPKRKHKVWIPNTIRIQINNRKYNKTKQKEKEKINENAKQSKETIASKKFNGVC